MLHEVVKITKSKRRVGRGIAAGRGKTAGRGTKGQKSRKGRGIPRFFEGGQTKLFARLPKIKGNRNRVKNHPRIVIQAQTVNKNFKDGEKVTVKSLLEKKLIHGRFVTSTPLKIIGKTKIATGIDVSACQVSGAPMAAVDNNEKLKVKDQKSKA